MYRALDIVLYIHLFFCTSQAFPRLFGVISRKWLSKSMRLP